MRAYRVDGQGRAAHEPSMMVALLLYSYAVGERSSRRIERRCVEDVATRVICANQRAGSHDDRALSPAPRGRRWRSCSARCCALCAEAGLVRVGVIAVDGTKVHANASQHATRDYEQIAREILEDADAVDAEEDERFGDARGDELPEELSTPEGRQRWLRDASAGASTSAARGRREPIPGSRPEAAERGQAPPGRRPPGRAATPTPPTRTTAGTGGMRNGRRLGRAQPAQALPAARARRRARSTSATWTRATSRRRAAGCRATTPRPSRPRIRSSSPPR